MSGPELTALLPFATAMSFTPGPNTTLAAVLAAHHGLRHGLRFALRALHRGHSGLSEDPASGRSNAGLARLDGKVVR